jgi:hypothetical protein
MNNTELENLKELKHECEVAFLKFVAFNKKLESEGFYTEWDFGSEKQEPFYKATKTEVIEL